MICAAKISRVRARAKRNAPKSLPVRGVNYKEGTLSPKRQRARSVTNGRECVVPSCCCCCLKETLFGSRLRSQTTVWRTHWHNKQAAFHGRWPTNVHAGELKSSSAESTDEQHVGMFT